MSENRAAGDAAATLPDAAPVLTMAGERAVIRLCRPAQHNRIDPSDIAVLMAHLDSVRANAAVRVLVLTGTGDKTFSSGYTLQAIRDQLDDRFEGLLDAFENFPLPVVCALNGSVYGGSTDLALCCDFRIGVKGSRLLMPASKFGLHYYPGGISRYVKNLGLPAAKKLFLTALPIDADEMLRIGYLSELVEPAELERAVDRYCEAIAACDPVVLASMKRHLDQTAEGKGDPAAQYADHVASLKSAALAERLSKSG